MELPLQNFDDRGPRSPVEMAADIRRRYREGETIWEVVQAGHHPIGVIGYAPISHEVAALHGVCFTSRVHHTGLPRAAMRMALDLMFATGISKVVAAHFEDNVAVTKFLAKLGFEEHHCDRHSVPRGGVMVGVRIVELSKAKYNKAIGMESGVPSLATS